MSSIARASSMKKLYGMREAENMTDFIIESENGLQFKVHSIVLISR